MKQFGFLVIVCLHILVAMPDGAAANLPLTIQEALYPATLGGANIPGVTRTADPITFGIPFPDDALNGITSTSVLGLTGTNAGQFRILAKWPSGRIKWVLVDTLGDITANQKNTSLAITAGSGNFGGANLAQDNNDGTITVTTGPAVFTIRKAGFDLLDQVVVGTTTLLQSGQSPGLVLTGPNPLATYPANVTCSTDGLDHPGVSSVCNHEYRSSNDPGSTVIIEENGPVKSVLKADGNLTDSSGNVYMHFTVRLYFYKGKTTAKATTILRNADYGTSNTFASAFKGHQGWDARLALNISGATNYAIATDASPVSGALSATDRVYIYQGLSKVMAKGGTAPPNDCPSAHDTNGYCVLQTNDLGFSIVKNASVIRTGTSAQIPTGWANISNGNGAGVEIGAYQFAAYGSKSLEFRSGGTDVRIGILASQNSQPYYQSWPQYAINDIWLNFHDSSISNPADEFLKFQHPLVAHADRTVYSSAQVFFHPLLDPAEEDSFFSSVAASASIPVSASKFLVLKDNSAATTNSTYGLYAWQYRAWEVGGGGNQMDFSLGQLYNFIRRGYTGGLVNAGQMYRFVSAMGFPRADGFTWRSIPGNLMDSFGQPAAVSANKTLATRNWPATWEHVHIYGMNDYYYMTGDETVREGMNGPLDRYLKSGVPVPNTERGVGGLFMNIAHLMEYFQGIGDTATYNALVTQAQSVYANSVAPDLCVSGYPNGCTATSNPRGISRVRGVFYAGGGTATVGPGSSEPNCGPVKQQVRGASTFLQSEFLEGMSEFRSMMTPATWPAYDQSLDLMYGSSQWALAEGYKDDASGIWAPSTSTCTDVFNNAPCGNGYRDLIFLDIANSCSIFYYPVRASQTVWYEFLVQHAYTGNLSWLTKFKMALQRTAYSGATDEFGYYTIGEIIDRALRPGQSMLVDVPVAAQQNADGTYTLSWTTPAGATSFRIKSAPSRIVPWIGFDPGTNTWVGDPSSSTAWFAAKDVASPPLPAAGGTQQMTVPGLAAGQNFAMKAWVTTVSVADTTAPTVNMTSPAAGATLKNSVVVSATATDNVGISVVQFKLDGSNLGSPIASPGPYAFSWNTSTVPNGAHVLSVVGTDISGNTAVSTISFSVNNTASADTTPPTVAVTSPASGATLQGAVMISATATDNVAISAVQFKLDGSNLGSPIPAPGPYSYSWGTSTIANGTHVLGAVATDTSGNTAVSGPVSISVNNTTTDTTPPAVKISAPIGGSTVSGTVAISASATDKVGIASLRIQIDSVDVGGTSGSSYTYSWNTTALSNGYHLIYAVAKDVTGNTATLAVQVIVSNKAVPATTISGVLSAGISGSSATVSWTTNTAADSQVAYGTTSKYGLMSALLKTMVTSHSVLLSGLSPATTYHFQALSHDASGNLAKSADFTFTTPAATTAQTNINIPINSWTTFKSGGFPSEIVGYDATVYASSIRRHVVLGKYHHYSSEPNYCMNGWSYDENRWDILDCGGYWHTEHMMEGGHPVGAFVYMPSRSSILMYGGQSGSNQPEQAFHTWWWDTRGRVGRDKLSESRPGNIKVSALAYDVSRDLAVFYPDQSYAVETYDPQTNRWSTPNTTGTAPPKSLTFPTLDWNSSDRKTYVYGGASGNSCVSGTLTFNADIYTFDPGTNVWSKLSVKPDPAEVAAGRSGIPAGRWYAGFAYDPDDNMFLLFGGQYCNGQVPTGLTDTWKFDPAALQWTRLNPTNTVQLRTPADAPFQKLRYDPDHHAFVMLLPSYDNNASTDGTWANYPARVWVYCYSACSAVGTTSTTYPLPTQSLNRAQPPVPSNQTWSSDAAIAAGNNVLYAGAVETSRPFTNGTCMFHHPYIQSSPDGVSWSNLGADCTALDSNAANVERDGEKLSMAVVNGALWATWSEASGAAAPPDAVFAKSWDGAKWSGGALPKRTLDATRGFQGFSQIIAVGNVPTVAFIENDRSVFPDLTGGFVDQYIGTSWVPLGGKLNVNTSSRAESIAITSDGANPWACWTEEVISSAWASVSPAQLYCARWTGTAWNRVGGVLNRSAGTWAAEASMTYLNGVPYLAWTERTTSGNAMVYVQAYTGSAWTLVGSGTINKNNTTGWAFHPRLANDGTNVYLSWEEQLSLGQPSRLYVSRWNGSSWSALGDALNIDAGSGSAAHSGLTISSSSPVAIWNEVIPGNLQQTFVRKWTGSSWVSLTGGIQVASACDLNGDGLVDVVDVQLAVNQAIGATTCTNGDVNNDGKCDNTDVQGILTRTLGGSCFGGQ